MKKQFKPSMNDISDFNQRVSKYQAYIAKAQQNRFTTGFDIVDADIRGIGAGEMMIIAAYSGTFKSAYLQNLLMGYSKRSGLYSLFFSLEMPDEKLHEREVQIANGVAGWEVEQASLDRNTDMMHKECLRSGAAKVLSVERPKLTLDHMAEYIEFAKLRYDLGVVAIDYLGLMKGNAGRSSADLTEDMSNGAKELSKTAGLPVIVLTQINRAAAKAQSDDGCEIELHHLKYGGEAGADIVLGLFRDPEESLVMKVLKNRGGAIGNRFKANIRQQALRFDSFEYYTVPKKKKKGAVTEEEAPF